MSNIIPISLGDFPRGEKRWSNIIPFSHRDSRTHMSTLEDLRYWLTTYLVPHINDGINDITDSWSANVTALIAAVDAALASQAATVNEQLAAQNAAVTSQLATQDADAAEAMAAHFTATENRVNQLVTAANLLLVGRIDGLEATLNEFVSNEADINDATVATLINGTTTDSGIATRGLINTTVSQYHDATVGPALAGKADLNHNHSATAINSGTLAAARLPASSESAIGAIEIATVLEVTTGTDTARAVTPDSLRQWELGKRPVRDRAVFVGSSNVVSGSTYWPAKLAAQRNLTVHNYAVAGSGFIVDSSNTYIIQAQRAGATMNAAQKAAVKEFYIADGSNDARTLKSYSEVVAAAAALFAYVRTNFPNARIVVLPMIWPADAALNWPSILGTYPQTINAKAIELSYAMRDALQNYGNSLFIDESWTWFTGRPEFMIANGDVHPNEAGHDRIANWVSRALDGETIVPATAWQNVAPASGYATGGYAHIGLRVRRSGWDVDIEGTIYKTTAFPTGNTTGVMCTLPVGHRPTYQVPLFGQRWDGSAPGGYAQVAVDATGAVTLYDAVGGSSRGVAFKDRFRIG